MFKRARGESLLKGESLRASGCTYLRLGCLNFAMLKCRSRQPTVVNNNPLLYFKEPTRSTPVSRNMTTKFKRRGCQKAAEQSSTFSVHRCHHVQFARKCKKFVWSASLTYKRLRTLRTMAWCEWQYYNCLHTSQTWKPYFLRLPICEHLPHTQADWEVHMLRGSA